jgi:hypothetical protein
VTARELQLRAVCPDSFTVLGRRMRPLALGHLPLLQKYEADVLRGPAELSSAVLICSMRPRDVVPFSQSRWFELGMALWRRRTGAWDFEKEKEAFEGYWEYHTELPEVTFRAGNGAESVIPFSQHLRMVLIARLGYDPEKVEEVSYLQARWDYISYCEFEGWAAVHDFTGDAIDQAMQDLDLDAIAAAGAAILRRAEESQD